MFCSELHPFLGKASRVKVRNRLIPAPDCMLPEQCRRADGRFHPKWRNEKAVDLLSDRFAHGSGGGAQNLRHRL